MKVDNSNTFSRDVYKIFIDIDLGIKIFNHARWSVDSTLCTRLRHLDYIHAAISGKAYINNNKTIQLYCLVVGVYH